MEERRRAASALIESHDAVFRRTARRYSICAADSEDAYQRALEILLTKAPPIEGDSLVRWMQVVTKREALAVRRQRERMLSAPRPGPGEEDRDPLDSIASDRPDPTDRAASRERVARSGEALRALKPQEVRALTLKAEGYSYSEIGEITGWTYTKINRCMAEGRKRFLEVFAEIEQGKRCADYAAALSALADGEPRPEGAPDVQAHLRGCGPCRAKLRAFRGVPDRVLEALPAGPAARASTGGWRPRVDRREGRRCLAEGEGGRLRGDEPRRRRRDAEPGRLRRRHPRRRNGRDRQGAGDLRRNRRGECRLRRNRRGRSGRGRDRRRGAGGDRAPGRRGARPRRNLQLRSRLLAETAVAAADEPTPAQQARQEFGVESAAKASASSGGEFSAPPLRPAAARRGSGGGFGFEN